MRAIAATRRSNDNAAARRSRDSTATLHCTKAAAQHHLLLVRAPPMMATAAANCKAIVAGFPGPGVGCGGRWWPKGAAEQMGLLVVWGGVGVVGLLRLAPGGAVGLAAGTSGGSIGAEASGGPKLARHSGTLGGSLECLAGALSWASAG